MLKSHLDKKLISFKFSVYFFSVNGGRQNNTFIRCIIIAYFTGVFRVLSVT